MEMWESIWPGTAFDFVQRWDLVKKLWNFRGDRNLVDLEKFLQRGYYQKMFYEPARLDKEARNALRQLKSGDLRLYEGAINDFLLTCAGLLYRRYHAWPEMALQNYLKIEVQRPSSESDFWLCGVAISNLMKMAPRISCGQLRQFATVLKTGFRYHHYIIPYLFRSFYEKSILAHIEVNSAGCRYQG